jgi:tRNA-2-methylthio-N6-dimethylallyladenosine synthase
MKLHTISLGCQMSAADGEELAAPLRRRGFGWAGAPEDADAIVISTCTVRQHAEDRALSLIGSLKPWKDADPGRVLIVAGCAAERLKGWLETRFPHVDLVVGAKSIEDYPAIAERALADKFDALSETKRSFSEDLFPSATGSPATAYLTIMRGCNYSCSYCIVPAVRGREVYRPVQTILDEAKRLLDGGVKEIMLLGQTVNSYRGEQDGKQLRFADLLRRLDALPGLERLRFMSPHPHFVDEAFADAMASCGSVCEQLHLPVQSGSDRLLALMKRNYTKDAFLRKAEMIRARVPGVVLSTDVIVGFPTETESDFEETLALVEELAPASAYCFKYSPREGTASADSPDDCPQEAKEERLARLNEVVERHTQAALKAQIGKTKKILTEQAGYGRTREGFNARWEGAGAAPGQLVSVKITSTTRRTLLGEIDDL